MKSASLNRFRENVCVQPVVIAELKFRDIQWEIFARNLVIAAHDAALNQRPETLYRVRVQCADNVLIRGMVNRTMRKHVAQMAVAKVPVGREHSNFRRYRLTDKASHRCRIHLVEHARHDAALALYRANDGEFHRVVLAAAMMNTLIPMAVLILAADIGFIDLYKANELPEFFVRQSGANSHAHMPRGFVRAEPHHAVDLKGAHALLAGQHQVDDAKPIPQGLVGVLKDRPGDNAEPIALRGALVALPAEFRCQRVDVRIAATRAADALAPAMKAKVRKARSFVRERLIPVRKGHLVDALEGRFSGHFRFPARLDRNIGIPPFSVKSGIIALAFSRPFAQQNRHVQAGIARQSPRYDGAANPPK